MGYNVTQPVYGSPVDEEELQIAVLLQPETEGGCRVRMQRLVPFDACSSLSEMQSKHALSSTCQARLTTVYGTICFRVPEYPSTRWTRLRSPEKPGYPVASPSSTSRIWRVPLGMMYLYRVVQSWSRYKAVIGGLELPYSRTRLIANNAYMIQGDTPRATRHKMVPYLYKVTRST